MTWPVYAVLSALAAGATAVLAKVGVAGVPSNLATAIRSVVILVFAWGLVLARGEQQALASLSTRSLVFLVLSGCATGLSWLAYFKALQLGPAPGVAALDKLSLVFTLVLAALFLGQPVTGRSVLGIGLMVAGALLVAR